MIGAIVSLLAQEEPTLEELTQIVTELSDKVTLDSTVFAEFYYFFTVAILWLAHVGFMAYEGGASRRKNVMSTAMKNILTIAVVTPTFYYFGWWFYGCFGEGIIPYGPGATEFGGLQGDFCSTTYPWSDRLGPNLSDHLTGTFWAIFALFSWTTASIMSGAVIERIRLSAFLILAAILGSVAWILYASWGWMGYGFLPLRWGFHDVIAGLVVHGIAGTFALGVLLNLGPRIGKFDREGRARVFRGHNTHLTLMGLLLIFVGFYGFYAGCLVIQSTIFPGWGNIYFNPTTLSSITYAITIGFAGGFTGGYFASRGDPFWTLSGGLAGVISVSPGADVLSPSLVWLISILGGALAVYSGTFLERKLRIDDAVGAVSVHGTCGFYGPLALGLFASGYPTGLNNVDLTLQGQLMGMLVAFPTGFLFGYVPAWVLKQFNLLRVPPEVELEGLDMAEFQQDFYPEFERPPEMVLQPTGEAVESEPVLLEAFREARR